MNVIVIENGMEQTGLRLELNIHCYRCKVSPSFLYGKIIGYSLQSKMLFWNSQRRPASRFYVMRDYNGNSKIDSKLNIVFIYFIQKVSTAHKPKFKRR